MGWGGKYTLSYGGVFTTNPSKHSKSLWKSIFFCFWKSHEIWGHLEAILRVLELIFDRGVLNSPQFQIGLKILDILYKMSKLFRVTMLMFLSGCLLRYLCHSCSFACSTVSWDVWLLSCHLEEFRNFWWDDFIYSLNFHPLCIQT